MPEGLAKGIWRFLLALIPQLWANPLRGAAFVLGLVLIVAAVWPTFVTEVKKAMAESKPPETVSGGGVKAGGDINAPVTGSGDINIKAPTVMGHHNVLNIGDQPAFFLAAQVVADGERVRVTFPIGGGTKWQGFVAFRIALARPCSDWELDQDSFFPVLRQGGLTVRGGTWDFPLPPTREHVSTPEIHVSARNTPLAGAKGVTFLLAGINPSDVVATEAHPTEAEATAAR